MRLTVHLQYEPKYVETRGTLLGVRMPMQWVAVVLTEGEAFGLRGRGRYRDVAVKDLVSQLRAKGLHGSLRIQ